MNKRQRKKRNIGGYVITQVDREARTITVEFYKSFQDMKRILKDEQAST